MKYAIVIPDGCADEAQPALQGKTPLEAANTPNMDRLAQMGMVGRANNVPAQLTPASDVATLSLFGYDPLEVYTGRAPLETAAMGIRLGPEDWAIRCNLVFVEDGRMRDFTAGHIDNDTGKQLIEALQNSLAGPAMLSVPEAVRKRLEFYPGVSYRNILVYRGDGGATFDATTKTQPPHDIPDQAIDGFLPKGSGSELLRNLMEFSREVFRDHPANKSRIQAGKKPATQVWLWGQGKAPVLKPFADRFGKRAAIISAVDLVRGVGVLLGWKRIDVPGATGYLDTDYAAKGKAAVAALAEHDLVCVHVEAPDEASHEGRLDAKITALEEIDRHIVGPLLEALPRYGKWRMLVEPDHRTPLRTRAHAHGEVPFVWAGTGIDPGGFGSYSEIVAEKSKLVFDPGHRLMQQFLA
ncbi:MAG: cofactor-independent phosphoglycerate mutase [Gemmatales bacterium]|nr:MAG: cofactor-independent phosphoglycerate mutase [Gemmatales bacterium]